MFAVILLILPVFLKKKLTMGHEEEQKILSCLVATTEKLECLKEHGRSKGER